MKRIMFNDQYGLTKAVLEGKKTMKRGIANRNDAQYHIGDIVAIAQCYKDSHKDYAKQKGFSNEGVKLCLASQRGWNNKKYVKAELMPHHIRITDVKVKHLQDITDEDCLKEGIKQIERGFVYDNMPSNVDEFKTHREAFASLIDNVSGKGTWESNPMVYVYSFELVD